jgi:hypothetical protein
METKAPISMENFLESLKLSLFLNKNLGLGNTVKPQENKYDL